MVVVGDVEETEKLRDAEALPTVKKKPKKPKPNKTSVQLKQGGGSGVFQSFPVYLSLSPLAVDGTTGAHLAHGFRAWMCECGLYLAAKHAPFMCF